MHRCQMLLVERVSDGGTRLVRQLEDMIPSAFPVNDLEREPFPHWDVGENDYLIINEEVLIN